jgi:predicted nuclease of predicted toxin-antitoxin system
VKLLANENFPRTSVALLRARGHDVNYVAETAASTADTAVLRLARRERRSVLTFDRDYGELIFRRREPTPAGVVFLPLDPLTPEEPGKIVAALLDDMRVTLVGYFTVVTRDAAVRQRRLPE